MGRKRRRERQSIKVTEEWFQMFCLPRLQERDFKIFRFLHQNRIATSSQLARLFWFGCKSATRQCNKRLRKLYDLHCIDRFFPFIESGSSLQHLVLDRAGARALELNDLYKISKLPMSYRHTVLVSEYQLQATISGIGSGKVEYRIGPIICDIFHPNLQWAVEIDTGTETYPTLKEKARRYNQATGIDRVIFVTSGPNPRKRVDYFLDRIHIKGAGASFEELPKLLTALKSKRSGEQ